MEGAALVTSTLFREEKMVISIQQSFGHVSFTLVVLMVVLESRWTLNCIIIYYGTSAA